MKKIKLKFVFIAFLITTFITHVLLAQTNISAGNVSGTWTKANSSYYILGEITIPNYSTLTIEPGVNVIFKGHYKFNVQGSLLAVGTQFDSIRFTAEDTQTGWHGIRFYNTPNTNDTSKIFYCSFKYGKANTGSVFDRCGGAIMIKEFNKVLVSNCLFDSNMQIGAGWSPPEASPAIYIYYASPIVRNSTFTNNGGSKGSAVGCITCPNAIVSNNIFLNNSGAFGPIVYASNSNGIISGNIISNNVATWGGGGILVDNALVSGSSSPRVENNIIIHNQAPIGGGIYCLTNANPVLINNTIAYNRATSGGGIYYDSNSDGILINNILFGNTATALGNQVFINDIGSDPVFKYCDVRGGKEGFGGAGAGANYTGAYEYNIDSDPLFVNAASDNYSLSNSSPCIGAGIDSIEVAGFWYKVPPFCISGNMRPSPTGSKPDIGARESLLGAPVTGVEPEITNLKEFILNQNYPNPFNPTTTIGFGIPEKGNVRLSILNILGEEIRVLLNEEKEAGYHSIDFNGSDLTSGVYFYRIQVVDPSSSSGQVFIDTKKMVLLK